MKLTTEALGVVGVIIRETTPYLIDWHTDSYAFHFDVLLVFWCVSLPFTSVPRLRACVFYLINRPAQTLSEMNPVVLIACQTS